MPRWSCPAPAAARPCGATTTTLPARTRPARRPALTVTPLACPAPSGPGRYVKASTDGQAAAARRVHRARPGRRPPGPARAARCRSRYVRPHAALPLRKPRPAACRPRPRPAAPARTFGDLLHVRANEPYTTTLGRAWTVMSGPHGQPYLRMFGQLRESTEQQLWPDFPPRGHHRLARAARPPPPDCCRSVPGGWTFSSTTPVSPAGRNLSRWLRLSGVSEAADVWSANRNSGPIRHSPTCPSRADLADASVIVHRSTPTGRGDIEVGRRARRASGLAFALQPAVEP